MILKKTLLFLFVLLMSMTNVLPISTKISLPLILGLICFVFSFLKLKLFFEDLWFILFIVFLFISTMLNSPITSSSIFYIIGFVISFLFYQKMICINYSKYKWSILKGIYYGTVILCIFIIYEFITRNFFPNLFFDLPRIFIINYEPTFLGKYIRARGFMEESGHTALFLEFSSPLVFYYLNYRNKGSVEKTIFTILLVASLFFVNSSISMVLFLGSSLAFCIYKFNKIFKKKNLFKIITLLIIIIFVLSLIVSKVPVVKDGVTQMWNKVNNTQNNDISTIDRQQKSNYAKEVLKEHWLIGIGPMNLDEYTYYDSSLNTSIDLWLFSGVFGLFFFILYILFIFSKLLLIKDNSKIYLMLSFGMVCIHYQIITNFWYPWIWVLIGIIRAEYNTSSKLEG